MSLPNTGIEVNIPRSVFETAFSDEYRNDNFSLSYKAELNSEQLIKGKDIYKEILYSIIKN